jgi:hypothetical protein
MSKEKMPVSLVDSMLLANERERLLAVGEKWYHANAHVRTVALAQARVFDVMINSGLLDDAMKKNLYAIQRLTENTCLWVDDCCREIYAHVNPA